LGVLTDSSYFQAFSSEAEEAKRLGVCLRTLINWRNEGKLPFYRIDRRILYRPNEVDRIMDERFRRGAP
jgi:predicted site-specific integrase-resolvase